jgi:hypothetical protein
MKPRDDDSDRAGDHELGMDRPITRRDFLNGVAIGIGGALSGGVLEGLPGFGALSAFQGAASDYPPALTGMRGSHEGSFEVSHALRDGRFWATAGQPVATGESYDLVVVGGGISGLSAAYFYRARTPSARILILDNHDDFGGHAKRNEFRPGGRLWIANGGTAGIESPFPFSTEAQSLMAALGVDPVALSNDAGKAANRSVFQGLRGSTFFDKETFGADRLVVGTPARGSATRAAWEEFLAKTPLSPAAQADIARLETSAADYLPGLSDAEKKDRLSRISYKDFLLKFVKVDPSVIPFYQVRTHGLYGIGIDAVGALECWAYHYPGFEGMHLDPATTGRMSFTARGDATAKPPYNFHFSRRQRVDRASCWCARSFRSAARPHGGRQRTGHGRLRRAGSSAIAGQDSPEQHRRARTPRRRSGVREGSRGFLRTAEESVRGAREGRSPGVLEHDDSVSVPGTPSRATGGAQIRRQGAARLHQRRLEELAGVQEAWDQRRHDARHVPHRRSPRNADGHRRLRPDTRVA